MIKRVSAYLFLAFFFAGSLFASEPAKGDTVEYHIDTALSRLYWSCNIHHGYLYLKQGCIKMADGRIVGTDILFQMDSIVDQDITYALMRKTLQNVLRSDVFFNTKRYPYARFSLDESRLLKNNEYQVTGDLELMDVVNCITFRVKIARKGEKLEVKSGKFYIDRLRWGITSYSRHKATSDQNFIVSDSIGISLSLKAALKE